LELLDSLDLPEYGTSKRAELTRNGDKKEKEKIIQSQQEKKKNQSHWNRIAIS